MKTWITLWAALIGFAPTGHSLMATGNFPTNQWADQLQQQGLADSRVVGVDAAGVPEVCATWSDTTGVQLSAQAAQLPQGVRSWEAVPSVVRDNGTDTFRLEVNVNGPVTAVQLDLPANLLSASGATQVFLRDDGVGSDRVANDTIFTSEPLRFNTAVPFAIFNYFSDSNSPTGLNHTGVGQLRIIETNGVTNAFLIQPQVGVLSSSITLVQTLVVQSNVLTSPHLINTQTAGGFFQGALRSLGYQFPTVTKSIYRALPDDFDFLTCIPTDHIERVPALTSANFIVGVHIPVKVDYSGTGQSMMDNSAMYGSAGRLKGINVLDTAQRGVCSANATHELLHQWSAYIDVGLGLSEADGAHYSAHSNIGSLVGGQLWGDNGDGTFVMNCAEGRNGAHRASALDLYMMGVAAASTVPVLRAYSSAMAGPLTFCNQTFSNLVVTATIADIIAREGVRLPMSGVAQRNFSIGFVVETRDRFLTDVEMTFYDILATAYVAKVPADQPDPYLTHNWVSIARFFGEDVTWKTRIDSIMRPRITSTTRDAVRGLNIIGTGFPGQVYLAQYSTNLISWQVVGTVTADMNTGAIAFVDTTARAGGNMFVRLACP